MRGIARRGMNPESRHKTGTAQETGGCAGLFFRPLDPSEAALCAAVMAASDPWRTLGRKEDKILPLLLHPDREVIAAELEGRLAGVAVVCLTGALVGYIQAICVFPEFRGHGVGSALLAFVERRIFREFPNVFLCVSSFNPAARRLYLRSGYEVVGELGDYVVAGYSEFLLRKTRGPMDAAGPA